MTDNTIRNQMEALGGDDSEEARAKIQKLQVQLEEAEEELRDTEYNKWYEDQNNMPIIISTEKGPNDLLVFDEAIGSRLIEMCRGNIIQLQGKELNYRLS